MLLLPLASTRLAAAPASGAPVVVGAVISMSGPFAPLGEPQRNALMLAQSDINAHGGIGGRPLQIKIVDDEGKPDVASQLATQFVGEGVAAITGGTITPTAFAISRVTTAAKKLFMYTGPTAQVWDTKDGVQRAIFEVQARNELEAVAILNHAKAKLHAEKLALLHDENAYGAAGERIVTAEAPKHGIAMVADESYPSAATDVTGQLLKVKQSGADTVMIWGASPSVPLIVRQIRQLGLTAHIVGSSGLVSDNFLRVAGKDGEGVQSTIDFNYTHPSPAARQLLGEYRNAYHSRATVFAAQAWDVAHLIAAAFNAAHGKLDTDTVAAALETLPPFHGATGTYKFGPADHNGLSLSSIFIATDRNAIWFVE